MAGQGRLTPAEPASRCAPRAVSGLAQGGHHLCAFKTSVAGAPLRIARHARSSTSGRRESHNLCAIKTGVARDPLSTAPSPGSKTSAHSRVGHAGSVSTARHIRSSTSSSQSLRNQNVDRPGSCGHSAPLPEQHKQQHNLCAFKRRPLVGAVHFFTANSVKRHLSQSTTGGAPRCRSCAAPIAMGRCR